MRPDLGWPDCDTYLEYDGEHHLDPDTRRRDRDREAAIRRHARNLIVVTASDLSDPHETWLHHLADALGEPLLPRRARTYLRRLQYGPRRANWPR